MTLTNALGVNELLQDFSENNNISFIQYIGILSLLQHTLNKNEEYYPKLKNYLKTHYLKDIYRDLESIKPLYKNLENVSSEKIQNLIIPQMSKDVIELVANSKLITLKQNFSCSGLYILFNFLLELDLLNFENWIINTQRIDFKIIFINIIQQIEDKNKKQIFLEKLQIKLLEYLSIERLLDYNIDYANVIGYIALELNNCNNLENYFNKKYKELSFPYSFCKIKNWEKHVIYMFYLLIGLYIYKKTNNEEFISYINKLRCTIGEITSNTIKDINEYLEQMK